MHAQAIAACDVIEVIAAADPSPDARDFATTLFPEAALLDAPEDVYSVNGVEAVLFATPTSMHPGHVRAALEAGLHVLCEKPLSLDPPASVELGEVAANAGLVLQVGFWRRYAPPWHATKQAIDEGRIGTPLYMRFSQWDADPPPASFCDPTVSGGLAIDCGVHEYDLAEWFSGSRVTRVRSFAAPIVDESLAAVGDVDNLVAVLELDGGMVCTVDLSRNCRYGDDVRSEVLGSTGAVLVDLLPTGRVRLGTTHGMMDLELGDSSVTTDVMAAGIGAQAEAFAAAIRGTGPVGPGADASVRATLIGHAVQASLRAGTAIDVAPIARAE